MLSQQRFAAIWLEGTKEQQAHRLLPQTMRKISSRENLTERTHAKEENATNTAKWENVSNTSSNHEHHQGDFELSPTQAKPESFSSGATLLELNEKYIRLFPLQYAFFSSVLRSACHLGSQEFRARKRTTEFNLTRRDKFSITERRCREALLKSW